MNRLTKWQQNQYYDSDVLRWALNHVTGTNHTFWKSTHYKRIVNEWRLCYSFGKEIVAVKMQTIYSRTLTLLKRRENLVSVVRRHASLLAFCVPVFPSVATTQWLIFRTNFETKNGKDERRGFPSEINTGKLNSFENREKFVSFEEYNAK